MNDSLLTINVVSADSGVVLALTGELDLSSVGLLTDALESVPPDAPSVTLDLAGLTFLDSSGLGAIARANTALESEGRSIVLRSPTPAVRKCLEIVALDVVVSVVDADSSPPILS